MKFIFSFLFFLSLNSFCLSQEVKTSPNKKYIAEFVAGNRGTTLLIKDQLTQKEEYYSDELFSVLHVQWTPDSTSLFIVEAISGGSMAMIVHHRSSCWASIPCNPPLQHPYSYFVMGVHFSGDIARVSYCVYPSRGGHVSGNSFSKQKMCIFDVNLLTGATILKKLGPLTKKDVAKLTKQEKQRWRMRENGTAEKEMKSDYF